MSPLTHQGVALSPGQPWWRAYFAITDCTQCGRGDGLSLGVQGPQYTVIQCDCNYAHIRDSARPATALARLAVIGGGS